MSDVTRAREALRESVQKIVTDMWRILANDATDNGREWFPYRGTMQSWANTLDKALIDTKGEPLPACAHVVDSPGLCATGAYGRCGKCGEHINIPFASGRTAAPEPPPVDPVPPCPAIRLLEDALDSGSDWAGGANALIQSALDHLKGGDCPAREHRTVQGHVNGRSVARAACTAPASEGEPKRGRGPAEEPRGIEARLTEIATDLEDLDAAPFAVLGARIRNEIAGLRAERAEHEALLARVDLVLRHLRTAWGANLIENAIRILEGK